MLNRSFIFIFSLTCLLNISYSQQLKKYRIVDSATKEKVAFATINIKSKSIVFDADSLGQIEHSPSIDDTVIITCVGYNDKLIIGLNGWNSEILLVQKPKTLPPVYVGNYPTKQVGVFESSVAFSMSPSLPDRTEYATLIRVPKGIAKYSINRLYFKIRTNKKPSNLYNPIRLHIYSVAKNGAPGEELLQSDVLLNSFSITKDLMLIDLSDQNIIISEKEFFVGLQWIKQQRDVTNYMQPQISFTEKGREQLTWRRSYQYNNYNWFLPATLSFWGNMIIKADLKVYEE